MSPESALFYSVSRAAIELALVLGLALILLSFIGRRQSLTHGRLGYRLIVTGLTIDVMAALLDVIEEVIPIGTALGLGEPGSNETVIMLAGFVPGTILIGVGMASWIGALGRLDREVAMRLEAQSALKEKIRQAEEANHSKAVFLASMSHELRTPLNAVIGFSQILKNDDYPMTEDQRRDYLDTIERSGSHLLHIINDILDLSRLDSGEMQLRAEACDIGKAVDEALDYCAPFISSRSLSVVQRVATGTVISDERAIRQIMLNLISNAVKFNKEHGEVLIEVASTGERLSIRVEDTGCGMSEEDIGRALEPFTQVTPHLTRRSEGLGLGLSLADRLVRALGGELTISSIPGTGTAIAISLPLTDAAPTGDTDARKATGNDSII